MEEFRRSIWAAPAVRAWRMFHYETTCNPMSLWRTAAIGAIRWGAASRLALIWRLAVTARVAPYPAVIVRARISLSRRYGNGRGGPGRCVRVAPVARVTSTSSEGTWKAHPVG